MSLPDEGAVQALGDALAEHRGSELPKNRLLGLARQAWPECNPGDIAEWVLHALRALSESGAVRLPGKSNKGAWDLSGTVRLPLRVTVPRAAPSRRTKVDASWLPELAFASHLVGRRREVMAAVNAFILSTRKLDLPHEPYRVRSLALMGDEKAFDEAGVIHGDTLLDRLPLSAMHAYNPSIPLSREDADGCVPVLLVVENLHAYDAIAMANRQARVFRSVAYGGGNRVTKRVLTSEAVTAAMDRSGSIGVEYFGDLDADGVDIAHRLSRELESRIDVRVSPCEPFYDLLARCEPVDGKVRQRSGAFMEWLPERHRGSMEALFLENRRIPQERLDRPALLQALATRKEVHRRSCVSVSVKDVASVTG